MNDDGLEQGLLYVEAELERGVSKDEIRKQLLLSGWSVEDVETVIRRIEQRGDFHSEYESSVDNQPYSHNQEYGDRPTANAWNVMAGDSAAGLEGTGFGGTGQAYYQESAHESRSLNPKAFFFFVSGALCFLLAVGLVVAVAAGLIQNRSIRFVVGLILFGGWLWKRGATVRSQ